MLRSVNSLHNFAVTAADGDIGAVLGARVRAAGRRRATLLFVRPASGAVAPFDSRRTGPREVERAVDESHVRERLREVPREPVLSGVV